MNILIIKILVDLICGALNSWGGFSWHNARRFIMPVVIGIAVSFITHIWWTGIMVLPVMGTLCLGYFGGKNWGRALWLFLQAVVIGLGLTLTGHLAWYVYIPYIIGAGVLGGFYKNWQQVWGDMVAGTYLGSIVYFIH